MDNNIEASDSEYDSEYGIEDNDLVDADYDTTYQDEDGMELPDRVQNAIEMGREILLEFPSPEEYSTGIFVEDEQRDIFDDGLESDAESSADSEASSNYEDLVEQGDVQIVRVRASPEPEATKVGNDEEEELDDNMTDAFDSERAFTSDSYHDMSSEDEDELSEQETSAEDAAGPTSPDPTPPSPKPFAELQQQKFKLLYDGKVSREKQSDAIRWKILELEEQKRHIEQELPLLEQELDAAETLREEKKQELASILETSGISPQLHEAYEAFCESLIPEFGQRGGFSITCEGKHEGSYIKYDPKFELFKEFIELPETIYKGYNYRCEASVTSDWRETNDIVEFWPLKPPVLINGAGSTWGDQYVSFMIITISPINTDIQSKPELYELARQAVQDGSAAAMQMMIALPHEQASCEGGWLFEYQYQKALADEPVVARRWTYTSAHMIDSDDGASVYNST